jgi:hypothetical protein
MAYKTQFSQPTSLKLALQLQPWKGRSDELVTTKLTTDAPVRYTYLLNFQEAPPPVISSSDFIPRVMIEHLMRNKKDSALGVKFRPGRSDRITNMEGAMHTYVTPLALVAIHGDYVYSYRHTIKPFEPQNGKQRARIVAMSAMIQPDFENTEVLLKVMQLTDTPVEGELLPSDFQIMSDIDKQSPESREVYDTLLRKHLIASLVERGRLPRANEVAAIQQAEAIDRLEKAIRGQISVIEAVRDIFVTLNSGAVVSLELLFNSALHQVVNEISALECMCPQGYVYTFDPPAIFAYETGATILNRAQFAALKFLSQTSKFANMRAYGFNDYDDEDAVPFLKAALALQAHVLVVPKKELFKGPKGHYSIPPGGEGALLVIRNNSDGFGQNIETEGEGSSMDGAIGTHSSAAASLHRRHPHRVQLSVCPGLWTASSRISGSVFFYVGLSQHLEESQNDFDSSETVSFRFYVDRAVGGDRHHRGLDRVTLACRSVGA